MTMGRFPNGVPMNGRGLAVPKHVAEQQQREAAERAQAERQAMFAAMEAEKHNEVVRAFRRQVMLVAATLRAAPGREHLDNRDIAKAALALCYAVDEVCNEDGEQRRDEECKRLGIPTDSSDEAVRAALQAEREKKVPVVVDAGDKKLVVMP